MSNKRNTGEKGEALAAEYLRQQGYIIIEKNWRAGHKEIDIICMSENVYIFVEVKTRRSVKMGMPEESVTESKRRSVTDAAEIFLQNKPHKNIRFDVISIILFDTGQHEILHIEDAFY